MSFGNSATFSIVVTLTCIKNMSRGGWVRGGDLPGGHGGPGVDIGLWGLRSRFVGGGWLLGGGGNVV